MKQHFVKVGMAVGVVMTTLLAGTLTSGAAPRVVAAHASPKYQYGISTDVYYNCETQSQWEAWGTTEVDDVKALGANSIAYLFPFYTDSATANTFYAKSVCGTNYETPSPLFMADLVLIAHAHGLRVFLRPELDQTNLVKQNPADWRGNIAPTNVSLWFRNYLTALTPYLKMAQSEHVERFAISTELDSLAYNSNWRLVVLDAKSLYSGNLVFTDSWNNLNNLVQWAGTSAGLDTYLPAPTATIKSTPTQLLGDWNKLLATSDPVKFLSSAVIDEIGIQAQDGAYQSPNALSFPLATHPFNQTIQANWFTMACSFMKEHKMGGIYFSGILLGVDKGALLKQADQYLPGDIQPKAQAAIKKCF